MYDFTENDQVEYEQFPQSNEAMSYPSVHRV